jgi:hypothetical protein
MLSHTLFKAAWRWSFTRRIALGLLSDDALLEHVERAHFEWFRRNSHPDTGLTVDRDGPNSPCSIAATGFSLVAHCIAAERGWLTRCEALAYARKTLSILARAPQGVAVEGTSGNWGLFYHFLDPATGTRAMPPKFWGSELSTIDTALLIAGVMFVRNYFNQPHEESQIRLRADAAYLINRVQWDRFVREDGLILHAWTPEVGMWKPVYQGYSEALLLYTLALSSPTHGIPASSWTAFCGATQPVENYGQRYIPMPGMPLFCYQYPHSFIDWRGIQDDLGRRAGHDHFENARRVALVHQAYAAANPGGFRGYSDLEWGMTACDGPGNGTKVVDGRDVTFRGYSERGCPGGFDDGTIAPTAALASIAYVPKQVLATLRHWLKGSPHLFDPMLGFVDAFNRTHDTTTAEGWVDRERLGIDQGPIVVQTENHRTGLVWKVMRRDADLRRGLRKAGFTGGWLDMWSTADRTNA